MTPTELVLAVTTSWAALAVLAGLLLGAVIRHADQHQAQQ